MLKCLKAKPLGFWGFTRITASTPNTGAVMVFLNSVCFLSPMVLGASNSEGIVES